MTKEKLKEIIFDLTEDPTQTELIMGYFSDYQKHQDEERVNLLKSKKTHNYNQTKKDHCEYCGVSKGMPCKDLCEAMTERYYNLAIDKAIGIITKEDL